MIRDHAVREFPELLESMRKVGWQHATRAKEVLKFARGEAANSFAPQLFEYLVDNCRLQALCSQAAGKTCDRECRRGRSSVLHCGFGVQRDEKCVLQKVFCKSAEREHPEGKGRFSTGVLAGVKHSVWNSWPFMWHIRLAEEYAANRNRYAGKRNNFQVQQGCWYKSEICRLHNSENMPGTHQSPDSTVPVYSGERLALCVGEPDVHLSSRTRPSVSSPLSPVESDV